MDRDKLDNALLRKVKEAQIEPLSDVWDRIAATLNAQGLTALGDATGKGSDVVSGAEGAAQPQEINIRRPKRLHWRYAAAAAAVIVCAIVLGERIGRIEELAVAEREGIEIVAVETGARQAVEQTLASRIPAAVGQRTTGVQTGMIAQATDNIITEPDLIQNIVTPELEQAPLDTAADQGSAAVKSVADDRKMTQTKSSDMRSAGGVPVYNATYGAEAEGRDRRVTPLAVSLYAGNFGTGKTVQNMPGGALRAASGGDFVVYETGLNDMAQSQLNAVSPPVSLKHRFPLSIGLNASGGLTKRLSVESGLIYSYLYSASETPTGNNQYKHEQKLHYLGVPIGVKYDIFKRPYHNIYVSGGALFEMCVSGQYVQTLYSSGVARVANTSRMSVSGIQSSANMQVGAEFKISKTFSVYLEPGVSYYFENARQPENYRTENPINMSLKAGVRIRIR